MTSNIVKTNKIGKSAAKSLSTLLYQYMGKVQRLDGCGSERLDISQ